MLETIQKPANLLEVWQLVDRYVYEKKWSHEQVLKQLCPQIDFPQNELRVRQLMRLRNLLPQFRELLLKGVHALDYLALLSQVNLEGQKYYWEKIVQAYRLNYNTQKKLFEWLYDWMCLEKLDSLKTAIDSIMPVKTLDELTEKLFEIRFPVAYRQGVRP